MSLDLRKSIYIVHIVYPYRGEIFDNRLHHKTFDRRCSSVYQDPPKLIEIHKIVVTMFATIRRQFLPRLSRASLTEQLQPSRSISYNGEYNTEYFALSRFLEVIISVLISFFLISILFSAASDITLVGSLHSQVRQISPDTKQFYFKTRNTFDN